MELGRLLDIAAISKSLSDLTYVLGFMLPTLVLHKTGIARVTGLARIARSQRLRLIDAIIAMLGVTLY
jgi:hydrogenase/urease accessory protein HupE